MAAWMLEMDWLTDLDGKSLPVHAMAATVAQVVCGDCLDVTAFWHASDCAATR